ncbi:uncharacterized protein LOC128264248 [Drosophila gunungcola]|uniref:uncharacterized protein LOC128264248 n=1 Tax=Drosophila gunungcola TaxID=103775 RepID=UPI0022DF998D|nr:uncharacterized protein LOC128264248 [Drosophila gunungcola]
MEPFAFAYLDDIVVIGRTKREHLEKLQETTKQVHSFLGVASWYRRFVPNFTELAQPLYNLVKKGTKFKWTEEIEEATKNLKKALTDAPVLACPDFGRIFVLQTDANIYRHGPQTRIHNRGSYAWQRSKENECYEKTTAKLQQAT